MATQIRRDPFARATLMRERVETSECTWCGQPGRFVYYWEPDSLRVLIRDDGRVFCSIDCWETYPA